ncbi:MAG: hypothetical protein EXR50_04510 [Dehalococcoidia bacterium]|nr:hypothetical protein [Dehalococcoidia bacterium]
MIKSIIILASMIAASKLLEDTGVRLNGSIMGVPYDLRTPTLGRIKESVWNPENDRVITPMAYGIGWTINLPSLFKTLKGFTG